MNDSLDGANHPVKELAPGVALRFLVWRPVVSDRQTFPMMKTMETTTMSLDSSRISPVALSASPASLDLCEDRLRRCHRSSRARIWLHSNRNLVPRWLL